MACHLAGDKPSSEQVMEYFNWALGNKLQWNLSRNLHIFIQENAFENVARKLAAILSRSLCVRALKYQPHKIPYGVLSILNDMSSEYGDQEFVSLPICSTCFPIKLIRSTRIMR